MNVIFRCNNGYVFVRVVFLSLSLFFVNIYIRVPVCNGRECELHRPSERKRRIRVNYSRFSTSITRERFDAATSTVDVRLVPNAFANSQGNTFPHPQLFLAKFPPHFSSFLSFLQLTHFASTTIEHVTDTLTQCFGSSCTRSWYSGEGGTLA